MERTHWIFSNNLENIANITNKLANETTPQKLVIISNYHADEFMLRCNRELNIHKVVGQGLLPHQTQFECKPITTQGFNNFNTGPSDKPVLSFLSRKPPSPSPFSSIKTFGLPLNNRQESQRSDEDLEIPRPGVTPSLQLSKTLKPQSLNTLQRSSVQTPKNTERNAYHRPGLNTNQQAESSHFQQPEGGLLKRQGFQTPKTEQRTHQAPPTNAFQNPSPNNFQRPSLTAFAQAEAEAPVQQSRAKFPNFEVPTLPELEENVSLEKTQQIQREKFTRPTIQHPQTIQPQQKTNALTVTWFTNNNLGYEDIRKLIANLGKNSQPSKVVIDCSNEGKKDRSLTEIYWDDFLQEINQTLCHTVALLRACVNQLAAPNIVILNQINSATSAHAVAQCALDKAKNEFRTELALQGGTLSEVTPTRTTQWNTLFNN